jgi:hypothetical protein
MTDKSLTDAEELSLGAVMEAAEDLEDDSPKAKRKLKPVGGQDAPAAEPSMTDPAWSEFAMRHFAEDELDPSGAPLVAGLRRVGRLLLGPVLESSAHVVQAPSLIPTLDKLGKLQPAVVEHRLRLLMCRTDDANLSAYEVTFTDAADVYFGNTDEDYARHATATAATRAEARCWRKALQIKGVAAEEKTLVPAAEAAMDGMITPDQENFINVLCRRNNINVMKYVNMGKTKFETIETVQFGVAQKMIEFLSDLQNGKNSRGQAVAIPDAIRGYEANWRK